MLGDNVKSAVLSASIAGDVARYNSKVRAQNFRYGAASAGVSGVAALAASVNDFAKSGIDVFPDSASSRRYAYVGYR